MVKILIADDEKEERNMVLYLIQKYRLPLEPITACNGKEALDILEKESIPILFTDIQMPFLNGLELASLAKTLNPSIEIIFLSGYDDFQYAKHALSLKAVNYLLKPINPAEFCKSINDVLESISPTHNFYQDIDLSNSSDEAHSSVEDSLLLAEIEEAIRLKNPEIVKVKVTFLLNKYMGVQNISHIYIRYLCTTLLKYLLSSIPETESQFQSCVDIIYSFQHFSEIQRFILSYLEKSLEHMELEMQSPKYSIYMIEQYIHSHYMEDLSLNQLADIVYLSPKYLSSMFSQTTGISINKYIKKVRLDKAEQMLLHTNMKIVDISLSVGYPNISYFCKIFQEDFGMTPEKYRLHRGRRE